MIKENVPVKKKKRKPVVTSMELVLHIQQRDKSNEYNCRNSYDVRNLQNLNNFFNLSNHFIKVWKNLRQREDREMQRL